jgi:NAD(P)-dependent dehydrogenase (short-subunit alcohol dehydrogenase family)
MTTTNRIALITGANRGLGRVTTEALAGRGMKVVATYRGDPAKAEEVLTDIREAGGDGVAVELDLADTSSISRLASTLPDVLQEAWGRREVDVLINNAGIGVFGTLDAITAHDLDALFDTNVRGTILVTQAIAPLMTDGGRILTVSSSLARHVSVGTSAYAASKAAIEVFSRSLARELGPRGIRVNTIAPGPTATDFNGGAMRDDDTMREYLTKNTALERVGSPDEIADAIAGIVSDDLRWMTAERIEVSGGAFI